MPELGLFRGMDAKIRSVQLKNMPEVVWTSISDFGLILERTIEPCKAGQTEDGVVALKHKSNNLLNFNTGGQKKKRRIYKMRLVIKTFKNVFLAIIIGFYIFTIIPKFQ